MKIKKGDMVQIISGKDCGKQGKVLRVFPKSEKILVEGVALRKKHQRPRKQGQKGEVVTLPTPFHTSNAMLFCKNCGKGSRAGYKFSGDVKTRICKRCKNEI
ncbi:MAG: 50S ribosomal protein L24 [Parcubacteria group bacterium GW2011_GWC1_45_13]|uniref:Large ribosomal subunit protein uL24 n=3 Tax=Candidatus Giovannoniibacteriota TaxID=1752738 RepID=A0A0G1IXA3_9BACT|nr:MAG: 50S ribosomal protein L24 [Candidatus Giovannonibacteria bacterium GW2011_GWB1_44_23]KKT64031.1 MAG: 50S ribosomal protein L24 [Candidatus Giovannonibacteria bacterium GW2011_GWA1_44_29]KKT91879.1 MAG: 50S ribosomal protein L24 [Parcubacteria group bacterium GW2011_GWC1_45_13]